MDHFIKGDDTMSEIRERLKPLLNKRVKVRGTFAKWDDHWVQNYREVGRACISSPEIDSEVVCQHVWVVNVPHWKQHKEAIGSQVQFDAVVTSYVDRATQKTNYCFAQAGDLTVLHLPAIPIPDPPKERDATEEWDEPEPDAAPELDSMADPSLDPMEVVRQLTTFTKTCGGYDQAEKMLEAQPPIPVPELLELIRAMRACDEGGQKGSTP